MDGNNKTGGRMLDKRGAAEFLGTGVRGVEGLMARRALPFYRISARAVRFAEADLVAFLLKTRVK
jgi:hypothetical protein